MKARDFPQEAIMKWTIAKKHGANERSLCGAVESSPRGVPEWDWPTYFPGGAAQAKMMAEKM
jgi:hypothetical protein